MFTAIASCNHIQKNSGILNTANDFNLVFTGWGICSGTANRGYCEAVIEVMTNFFGLYSNIMFFN